MKRHARRRPAIQDYFMVPACWEQWTEEERLAWCGREMLAVLREMFDDHHLGRVIDFDRWVDGAPLNEKARRSIALARQAR